MSEPPAVPARRTQPSSAPDMRWARRPRAAQESPGAPSVAGRCRSIPLRRPRIGVIDDAPVAVRKSRDLGHLGRRELEVENREIFRQPFEAAGPWDDRDALLHQEAQAHLRRGLAVRLADAREHLVPVHAAAGHRAIGHDRHAVPPAGGDHLRLVDEGMHLDLVAHQRLLRELHGLLDQRDGEVRHADVARKSHTLDLAERAERVAQRNLRIRPVQQEQIDLRELQPLQARLRGTLEVAGGKVRRPHLRGDEHLLAFYAGGAQSLPHLAFVVVKLGGVDVAVAAPQRLFDDTHAGAPAQLPGAEADEGNARAVRFDHARRNGCHRSPPFGIAGSPPQLSQRGACGGLTTRMRACLSLSISAISASLSLKSKTARLAARWSRLGVRGIATMPCCTRYRSAICAALLPWLLPTRASTSLPGTLPRASGQ